MTLFIYAGGVDIGSHVRLGGIPGLISDANQGNPAICGVPIDDPGSALNIIGWQQFIVNETDGPAGQRRLYTGFVLDRIYRRDTSRSMIVGTDRLIDTNIVDMNTILSFRVIPQTDTTANRPQETDVARLQWILGTSYLSPALSDTTYQSTTGPITLDAADYRSQSVLSIIGDCSQASGKNFFVWYNEANGQFGLFYDFDYSPVYSCTLTLSNVLSDIDNSTCFAYEEDAQLERDPTQVYSGVNVPYSGTGSPQYVTDAATATTFGVSRDTTAPNVNLKTATAAQAVGFRYLLSVATEDDKITLTAKLPSSKVTLVRAGMRIQVKASHLPGLTSFTWCRILHLEAKQDEEVQNQYNVTMELTPPIQPAAAFCSNGPTTSGTYAALGSGTSDANGNLIYWKPGLTAPTVPTPGYAGGWNFPAYSTGGGDEAGDCTGNQERIIVAGNGTLSIPTYQAGGPHTYVATLYHIDPVTSAQTIDQTKTGNYGDTIVFNITGWSKAGGPCYHFVDVNDNGGSCGVKVGYNGFTWSLT